MAAGRDQRRGARALGVNHHPHRVERRFGDRFGEGWMRVNREIDFLDRELILTGDGKLVDQLGRVRADDMRAKDLSILRVANDLDEAFRLTRRARTAVGGEGKATDFVVELLVLALLLSESDRRDLGMAVRGAGNIPVVDAVRVLTGENLGNGNALA